MPDKWIDQLQKIKTDMQSKAEVSIIDEDVTGVQGNNSAPDNLFYSEFSEEVAVAFFDIFARFGKIYETNSRDAIDILIDNIEVKNDAVNIMPLDKSYGIFDSKLNIIEPSNDMSEEKLVTDLIALSPKSINIYCSEILSNKIKTLICKLFEKRVKFVNEL